MFFLFTMQDQFSNNIHYYFNNIDEKCSINTIRIKIENFNVTYDFVINNVINVNSIEIQFKMLVKGLQEDLDVLMQLKDNQKFTIMSRKYNVTKKHLQEI